MKPEIATLHERMSNGGDWRIFRDEIAELHDMASCEDEYVTLLQAHQNLVAVGKFTFSEEIYSKLLLVSASEYMMFLNKEAMDEDGQINPVQLERITRREVAAGRLKPDDSFRKLAIAGASVLGDSTELSDHRCKSGSWFFYGAAIASIVSVGLEKIHWSPYWLIAIAFFIGWFLNECEIKSMKSEIAAKCSSRPG